MISVKTLKIGMREEDVRSGAPRSPESMRLSSYSKCSPLKDLQARIRIFHRVQSLLLVGIMKVYNLIPGGLFA